MAPDPGTSPPPPLHSGASGDGTAFLAELGLVASDTGPEHGGPTIEPVVSVREPFAVPASRLGSSSIAERRPADVSNALEPKR